MTLHSITVILIYGNFVFYSYLLPIFLFLYTFLGIMHKGRAMPYYIKFNSTSTIPIFQNLTKFLPCFTVICPLLVITALILLLMFPCAPAQDSHSFADQKRQRSHYTAVLTPCFLMVNSTVSESSGVWVFSVINTMIFALSINHCLRGSSSF